jgi:hypothetical protein
LEHQTIIQEEKRSSPLLALALCSASLALAKEAIDTRPERDA